MHSKPKWTVDIRRILRAGPVRVLHILHGSNVTIMSARYCRLLVGEVGGQYLDVYQTDTGHLLSTIQVYDVEANDDSSCELHDATWTPDGNLIYSTYTGRIFAISITSAGKQLSAPKERYTQNETDTRAKISFSVSDDVIFAALRQTDRVLRSVDNGRTWDPLDTDGGGGMCLVIALVRVNSIHGDKLWVSCSTSKGTAALFNSYAYNKTEGAIGASTSLRLRLIDGDVDRQIFPQHYKYMAYDGHSNVILAETKEHSTWIFPASTTNNCISCSTRLINSNNMSVNSMATDVERAIVHIGYRGIVHVYPLVYEV